MSEALELGKVLSQCMAATGLPLRVLAENLEVDPIHLMQQIRLGKRVVHPEHIHIFEEKTGIDFETIVTGNINRGLLRRRMLGERKVLPERYDEVKGSRIRSSANIVEYLRFIKGWDWVRDRLSKLQLHESLFEFPDEEINFRFFLDLFHELEIHGIDDHMIKLMAYHSVTKNETTPFGQEFKAAKNLAEVYRVFERKIAFFDVNFDYRFENTGDHVRLFISPKKNVMDALNIKIPGNRQVCIYKQALFSSFAMYVQARPLHVNEHKCMYLGDHYCEYSADLGENSFKPLLVVPHSCR